MDGFVLVGLLSVALWGRQVHSVAVVVLPVGFVVEWLLVLGEKTLRDLHAETSEVANVNKYN